MSDINRNALLPRYRRLMTPSQWRQLSTGLTIGVVAGALTGFALLALLPTSVAGDWISAAGWWFCSSPPSPPSPSTS